MTQQAPIRTRSWLFTPATRPERFAKASQAGADVAILDLEDAVAPGDKVRARNTALDYLAGNPSDGTLHALRINGLDTRTGISDLDALLGSQAAPDFLVLPKTETASHLEILMAADLGTTIAWKPLLALVSGRLITACAVTGVMPVDSPFFDLHDESGLKQEVAAAVALGFPAKAAIHPAQIDAINTALTPSAEAVERARKILAENVKGVGTVEGQMVDEAVARRARRTLVSAGLEA